MGDELNTAARAAVVNRTHRIVRERAGLMAARRRHVRSLVIPIAVSSALLMIMATAGWRVLDQYALNPIGIPEASNQIFVLLLWFVPVSMALLAMIVFRRIRRRGDGEVAK